MPTRPIRRVGDVGARLKRVAVVSGYPRPATSPPTPMTGRTRSPGSRSLPTGHQVWWRLRRQSSCSLSPTKFAHRRRCERGRRAHRRTRRRHQPRRRTPSEVRRWLPKGHPGSSAVITHDEPTGVDPEEARARTRSDGGGIEDVVVADSGEPCAEVATLPRTPSLGAPTFGQGRRGRE